MVDIDAWLASLGPEQIAGLLTLRPDVVGPPAPHDLAELAARLDDPHALAAALQTANLPSLQAVEALQALGGHSSRAVLRDFLDGASAAPAGFDRAVEWLVRRAIIREGPDGVLTGAVGLDQCYPRPLQLGPPLRTLLATQTAEALKPILRELGVPVPPKKAEIVRAVHTFLADPVRVRTVVADAPEAIGDWITLRAQGEPSSPYETSYDPVRYRFEQQATAWAVARGLMFAEEWGYTRQLPAEVALALRGPDFRAPFQPSLPAVRTHPVADADAERSAAAAASAVSSHATAIADRIARIAVPALKSGGVGARELTRLAKATGAPEEQVRLILELAAGAGLLEPGFDGVCASADFEPWRASDPAERYRDLVSTWWLVGLVPSSSREDGKTVPALTRGRCAGCIAARHALFDALSTVEPGCGVTLDQVGAMATWTRPLIHAEVEQDDLPLATTWREAETLGLIAEGSLTSLGRLILAGDLDGFAARAATVLPGTVHQALFGTDLTAVVPGAPSAQITDLLDTCADRESRGAGVVWRFTPTSVRRALDGGLSPEELQQQLTAVARDGLPQPLRYLIGDIARRHGCIRVAPATCVLRSDDVALLAQVGADRALKRLGLILVAPTVLTSELPARDTLDALRAAGYLPMPDAGAPVGGGRPGPATGRRVEGTRRRRIPPAEEPVDLSALASRLAATAEPSATATTNPDGTTTTNPDGATASPTERVIAALAPRLPVPQARLLAHAVDTDTTVVIDYRASTGGVTSRAVSELALMGSTLSAWCELRQDERHFSLGRIQAVRVASAGS